jgi:hypothetical protein
MRYNLAVRRILFNTLLFSTLFERNNDSLEDLATDRDAQAGRILPCAKNFASTQRASSGGNLSEIFGA